MQAQKIQQQPPLIELLKSLEHSEYLPLSRLQELQNRRLNNLVQHHKLHSPSFSDRLHANQLAQISPFNIEQLQRLTPLSRRDIQTAGANFNAKHVPPSHGGIGEVKTSGSTGEPVALMKTALNRLCWSAFTIRDHAWNKRRLEGRLSSIRANIDTYVELPNWGLPVSQFFKTGPAQGIPITTPITKQLELLRHFQPDILLLYPNNLRALLELWSESSFTLPSLKHLKTIGETVPSELRERAREICNLEIEDNYSSQEAGPIAIQCKEGGQYHVMSEALIVEVLDNNNNPCDPGQVGRLVVTDLHNYAAPLIRYDIGDYAEQGDGCSCGRTLPTLRRVLGRERNLIRHRNGDRHWPLVGFHNFDKVAPVRQYQFIQHSFDEIEFRLQSDAPLSAQQKSALQEICAAALGKEFHFTITESRERLPSNANGKFEEFVCKLP